MENYEAGLRSQDVHQGLRNMDPHSPALVPLTKTRLVGSAADVASLIRGREVVQDVSALQVIAVRELDVAPSSFEQVLDVLETAGFIDLARNNRGEPVGLTENVPVYRTLYEDLGSAWRESRPRQIEEEMLAVVRRLAKGPIPVESLVSEVGVGSNPDEIVMLGRDSSILRVESTLDGDILYSPFSAFENPSVLNDLLMEHGSTQMQDEFEKLHGHQGLPITAGAYPMLTDAVARGLISAPSVALPDGKEMAFAVLPYTLDRELLTGRKPVLDKALAIVACVRCGQQFGGSTNVASALSIIDTLLDPARGRLSPHSSHERQYALMRNLGVIRFDADPYPGGTWVQPVFVNTRDNREAMGIARELIASGEMMTGRTPSLETRKLLDLDASYLRPIQTVSRTRARPDVSPAQYRGFWDALMGRGSL
ncbi:hypothetical protein [Streptomyces griseoflavus]|uniref:hypothetical protein n=1 Tax=Streptomyces griseoflavus TaxID=35619 RepID=UPI00167DE553|nr:hypothetical protein [Streptomyces griseoflavus]